LRKILSIFWKRRLGPVCNRKLSRKKHRKLFAFGVVVGALAALVSAGALAQVDSRFVITGEDAARNGEMNMINAATARGIAQACERMATERDMDMAIVILDNFGNVVHQHRMDGAARYTAIHTAELKAETARLGRRPSKVSMNNVIRNPNRAVREWNLGNFPNSGGLPIWVGEQIIGFVGVGGMAPRPGEWTDEICAHRALEEVVGPQPALLEDLNG
jgi:glc operon protein GlcG